MEPRRQMPERQPPKIKEPRAWSDKAIGLLRQDESLASLYVWLTDTLVPFILAVVIVVPVGAVLLLFYLPKFYRNWRRRHWYGVAVTLENGNEKLIVKASKTRETYYERRMSEPGT